MVEQPEVIDAVEVPQIQYMSCGHSSCEWKMVISILTRGLCVPEACYVRIELVPWMDRQP